MQGICRVFLARRDTGFSRSFRKCVPTKHESPLLRPHVTRASLYNGPLAAQRTMLSYLKYNMRDYVYSFFNTVTKLSLLHIHTRESGLTGSQREIVTSLYALRVCILYDRLRPLFLFLDFCQ